MVEADESDGTFLALAPEIAVVTNVEADHLDYYGSFAALRSAFEAVRWPAPGHRVVGADDPVAAAIGRAVGADVVGTGAGLHLPDRRPGRWPAARSPSAWSARG